MSSGLIDPNGGRERRWFGRPADEAFRVSLKGDVQHGLPVGQEVGGSSMMNHSGGHQAQAGVVMFLVVPTKEGLTKGPSVFDGAEAIREARALFQGAELTF